MEFDGQYGSTVSDGSGNADDDDDDDDDDGGGGGDECTYDEIPLCIVSIHTHFSGNR